MRDPKEITINLDLPNKDEIASFDYSAGMQYAKEHNLVQTTTFREVRLGTHFIVCSGDVMVKVTPDQFKNITRRKI